MGEKVQKVKKHLAENKQIYIISAINLATLGTVVYLVRNDGPKASNQINSLVSVGSTQNISQITVSAVRGHRGNRILDNETGVIYPSQNVAADALGIDPGALSKHLNGKNPHVNGKVLTNLGEDLSSRE